MSRINKGRIVNGPAFINGPFPTLEAVRKIMGISKKRMREIEAMVEEIPSKRPRRKQPKK